MGGDGRRSDRGLVAVAAGRDRVLDATKAIALLVVVIAHSVAWDVGSGTPRSILDVRPDIAWVTWILQPLPLFFAAGAVGNLGSWRRQPDPSGFLRRRLVRLASPALVYAGFWTLILVSLAAFVPMAELAGRFLAQLLWFLGVYAAVVVAVPWTARWVARPALSLASWLAAIVLVDVLRWNASTTIGWVNLFLVWGFLHQAGFHLPALRTARPGRLLAGALTAGGSAVVLAVLGPYSSSLVSYVGDPEPSNLSPPTLVIALYGLGQVLGLAALWPSLDRLLARDRLYLLVGMFGSRAIAIYLWHLPLMAAVAGAAWALGFSARPLGPTWWLVHAAGFIAVLTLTWLVAGLAGRADRALRAWAAERPWRVGRALPFAVVIPPTLLNMSQTGFGTWWGRGVLGIPSSSALNLVILAAAWWGLAPRATRPTR